MFTNAQGWVLLKWVLNRPPKLVKIDGTDRLYTFSYIMNVCASWVHPDDVNRMLATKEKTCNCSNGTYKYAFAITNLLDTQLWVTGGRNDLPEWCKEISKES